MGVRARHCWSETFCECEEEKIIFFGCSYPQPSLNALPKSATFKFNAGLAHQLRPVGITASQHQSVNANES